MRFLSCFSGIEAASVAWTPLGWQCVGVAEVEPFPCAVLAHHYPDVPNLGDVTANDFLQRASALRPDVLVGGPPCQDFSVAGLRAGLAGDRGNLSLRWVEIIRAIRPVFAVTENVPGWLSVNGGHAFGAFLAGLVGHDTALVPPKECGGWTNAGMVDGPDGRVAWRILDAQHFGLAQRRKRVFAVFCPRDGADPAAVLFERQGVHRDSPPRREAGEGASGTLSRRATAGGGPETDFECSGGVVAPALTADYGESSGRDFETAGSLITHSVCADGFDASEDGTGRGTPPVPIFLHCNKGRPDGRKSAHTEMVTLEDIVPTLATDGHAQPAVAVALRGRDGGGAIEMGDDCAHALRSSQSGGDKPHVLAFHENQRAEVTTSDTAGSLKMGGGKPGQGYPAALQGAAVRRLTPEECEALQGFPRLYTRIPYGKKGKGSGWSADGPRYRALGNSMAVPCMAWIGSRIAAQEAKAQQAAA